SHRLTPSMLRHSQPPPAIRSKRSMPTAPSLAAKSRAIAREAVWFLPWQTPLAGSGRLGGTCGGRGFPQVGAAHIGRSWLALGVSDCLARNPRLESHRADLRLLGYVAARDQHWHDDRHVPDGLLDPEHTEPRRQSAAPEARRAVARGGGGAHAPGRP